MDLRSELLEWLVALPAMDSVEGRRELLALAGPESPCRDLQPEGSRWAFAEQLLDTVSRDGPAALLDLLAALHSLPQVATDAGRHAELVALEGRLAALTDREFRELFLRGGWEMAEFTFAEPEESADYGLPTAGAEPPSGGSPVPAVEPERPAVFIPRGAPSGPAPAPPPPAAGTVYTDMEVGRDLIGRDQVVHGDQVAGPKYQADTINIYQGSSEPDPAAAPLIEESIRLDVATPTAAFLEVPFDLAVAVRQPNAPALAVEDLNQVKSQEGTVYRRQDDEIVEYRIAVTARGCDVDPPDYTLWLRPGGNSAPCFFQITPHRSGKVSIFVSAYQQDEVLAAQTRLSIEVQVPVSPTG